MSSRFTDLQLEHLKRARVLWTGLSRLNGKPVVAIAIPDSNPKTAKMVYTYVLPMATPPVRAAYTGADEAICGNCKFRAYLDGRDVSKSLPDRPCYVRLTDLPLGDHMGADEVVPPDALWDAWERRLIENTGSLDWMYVHTFGWFWVGPEPVRLGSYGDPAAVPTRVWSSLVQYAKAGWTGYTHQWDNIHTDPGLKELCMASVDTLDERAKAKAAGWRTFLVVPPDGLMAQELQEDIFCPMSAGVKRADGTKIQCQTCRLCNGTARKARSIWEKAHSNAATLHSWES